MQHRLLRRERRPHEAHADSGDVQPSARRRAAHELRHPRLLAFQKVGRVVSRRDEGGHRHVFAQRRSARSAVERFREQGRLRERLVRRRRRVPATQGATRRKRPRVRHRGQPALLSFDAARRVRDDRRIARGRGPRPEGPGARLVAHHHREAVRHGSRFGTRVADRSEQGLRREGRLPHRPLSRQGAGAGHHGAALRQRDVRTDLEPALRGLRADHGGRDGGRRGPRRVLRAVGRAQGHDPESRDQPARARGDGAASTVRD